MLHVEASLLLASNASSGVPRELLNESGCKQQELQHSTNRSSKLNRKLNGAALIKATEECTNNINKDANLMAVLVERKTSPSNVVMSTPATMPSTPPTKKTRHFVDILDDVRRLREHKQEIMEDIGVIRQRRK